MLWKNYEIKVLPFSTVIKQQTASISLANVGFFTEFGFYFSFQLTFDKINVINGSEDGKCPRRLEENSDFTEVEVI